MGEEACSDRAKVRLCNISSKTTYTNTPRSPKVSSPAFKFVSMMMLTMFGFGQSQFYYNRVLQGENVLGASAYGNAISELDYVKTGFGNGTTASQVKFISTTQQLRVNNRVFTKTTSNTFSNTGYILWFPTPCSSNQHIWMNGL